MAGLKPFPPRPQVQQTNSQNRGRRPVKENPNRINNEITAPMVRVVGDNVEPNLVIPIAKALAIADEMDLDLVEISPNAVPPVCKILDYQKFLYQQKKMRNLSLFHSITTLLIHMQRWKIMVFVKINQKCIS